MAFPTNLTNAVDGVTDVVADHLNNLEAKVGIEGSLVTTSLDYLLKNSASVDPGHGHTQASISGLVSALAGKQASGNYITALTGDVAAAGPGSAGATIQAGAVTLSKMATLAASSLLGNNTAAPATPLALSADQVKSLLAITQADITGLTTASSPTFAALTAASLTSSGALGLTAGGSNQNIILTPSGSGYTILKGNVGIGTTSPGTALDISLSGLSGNQLRIITTGASAFGANFKLDSTSSGGHLYTFFSGGSSDTGRTGCFSIYDNTGAATRLVIDFNGNLVLGGLYSANAAALLHLSSTTKGFLPPVMTTTQKNAISSPPAGLVVYDSTLSKLCVYTGAAWQSITSA